MAFYRVFQGQIRPEHVTKSAHYTLTCGIFRSLIILSYFAVGFTHASNDCENLSELNWLLGTWQQQTTQKVTEEHWAAVSESSFEGKTTTRYTSKDSVYIEHLRLVAMLDGVFYLAMVPENPLPVPFKAMECQKHVAVFENQQHDFPQRLRYELIGEQLHIRVENIEEKGFDLKLSRLPE